MSGVTIGDRAIIGCNTIITKDVPPYAVVVGNPSKIVKYRFEKEVIDKLLYIKWWDMDIASIQKHVPLLLNEDIEKFIY